MRTTAMRTVTIMLSIVLGCLALTAQTNSLQDIGGAS